ncbi:hypothetical protein [Helicobacter pylori]|uniref:hypothetical protein n=1 Tax=Helicobacter pylori TaxID=210 RepID=UPI00193206FA|nr:hypothetical protein [Helicobacter pylori]MBS3012793.1 hypothetical protein [Helicobacter pylori]MBS3014282.1 hypothetical protein [Helicobacter pylori]
MRQTNGTATSFNQLREITQSIQAFQTKENANASELAPKQALKPKGRTQAKKTTLKPTKKAFSERQKTTLKGLSQESANASLKTNQAKEKGGNNEA